MNINDYVGLKYDDANLNCWNLFAKVSEEFFGIKIPVYENADRNIVDVKIAISEQISTGNWKKIENPKEGCAVIMKSVGSKLFDHIGICASEFPASVLHTMSQSGQSSIHSLALIKRIFKEVEFYSYEG